MANPKRKTSKSKRNMRRSHHALRPRALETCPRCQETKLPHKACPDCGYYRGRQAIVIKKKE